MHLTGFSRDIDQYYVDEEFTLQRAESKIFAAYATIYRNCDVDFLGDIFKIKKQYEELPFSFWIMKGKKRVAGVILLPNYIEGLFLIPPYNDRFKILNSIKKLLLFWSDNEKPIRTSEIVDYELDDYLRLGFNIVKAKLVMVRPTDKFDYKLDDDFFWARPDISSRDLIARILWASFKEGNGELNGLSLKKYQEYTDKYFKRFMEDNLLQEASCLVYDKEELIAVNLILLNNDLPLIYFTAVLPEYRGRGIFSNLLKRSLTVLNTKYPFLKLFVEVGNPAQAVYYKLGFFPKEVQYSVELNF